MIGVGVCQTKNPVRNIAIIDIDIVGYWYQCLCTVELDLIATNYSYANYVLCRSCLLICGTALYQIQFH